MQANLPPPSQVPIPQPGQIPVPQPGQIPYLHAHTHAGYTQTMYPRHMYPSMMPLSMHPQTMQPAVMYPTVMHGMAVYPENMQHGVMPTHPGAMFPQAMQPQGMYPQATHYHSTPPMQFQVKQPRQTILSPEELAQSRSSVITGGGSYLLSLPLDLTMVQIRQALWRFIPSSRADKEFIFFEVLNSYLPYRGQDSATVDAFCRYKPHQRYSPVDPVMVERKRREKAEKVEKAGKLKLVDATSHDTQATSNGSQDPASNDVSQVRLNPAATTFVLSPNPSTVPTTPFQSQDHISDSDTATSHSPSMKVTALGIEGLAEVVETLELVQLAAIENPRIGLAASVPLPESGSTISGKSEARATSAPSPHSSPIVICGEQIDDPGAQERAENEIEENEETKMWDESVPYNRNQNNVHWNHGGPQMTYQQPRYYIGARVPDYCYPPAPAPAPPAAALPRQDYGQAYYERQLRLAQDEIRWFRHQSGVGYQQYTYPHVPQNPSGMGYMQWNWNHMG